MPTKLSNRNFDFVLWQYFIFNFQLSILFIAILSCFPTRLRMFKCFNVIWNDPGFPLKLNQYLILLLLRTYNCAERTNLSNMMNKYCAYFGLSEMELQVVLNLSNINTIFSSTTFAGTWITGWVNTCTISSISSAIELRSQTVHRFA